MPIATPEIYADMLDRAKAGGFAYPAINCTSSETINAALRGFAEAGSDGIIQFSTGGAEFGSGTRVKDMVTGAVALAEFAHVVAAKYPINVALHTDHCPKDKLDSYVRPLLAHLAGAGRPRPRTRCSSRTCGTGRRCRWPRTSRSRRSCWPTAARGAHRARDRDRGGRRRGGRRRRRDQRQALHDARGRAGHRRRRWAPARTAATCWRPRSATSTASTSRATSSCARPSCKDIQDAVGGQGRAGRSRSTWCSTAGRVRS